MLGEPPYDRSASIGQEELDPQGAALRALAVALVLGVALPLGAVTFHSRPAPAVQPRPLAAPASAAWPGTWRGLHGPDQDEDSSLGGAQVAGDGPPPAAPDTTALSVAADGMPELSLEATPTAAPSPRPTPWRHYPVPAIARASEAPFPASVYRWQPLVESELEQLRRTTRVDPELTPELVLAVITEESFGDPESVSTANAVGLMQVLPSTFADFFADADPFDPVLNIRAGIRYLNAALLEYDGDVEWALAAYYLGTGEARALKAGNGDVTEDTIEYVAGVLFWRDHALLTRGIAPPPPESLSLLRATATPTPTALPEPAERVPAAEAAASPPPIQPEPGELEASRSPTPLATPTRTASPQPMPSSTSQPSPTASSTTTPSPSPRPSSTPQSAQPVPTRPSGPAAAPPGAAR